MKDHALFSSTPTLIWTHSSEIKGVIPLNGVNLHLISVALSPGKEKICLDSNFKPEISAIGRCQDLGHLSQYCLREKTLEILF